MWGNHADRRSLAFHEAIAKKVSENPALVNEALTNIRRWKSLPGGRHSWPLWEAWGDLLHGPLEVLLRAMVEESDRMQQLRSATPFAGILSDAERAEVIKKTRV